MRRTGGGIWYLELNPEFKYSLPLGIVWIMPFLSTIRLFFSSTSSADSTIPNTLSYFQASSLPQLSRSQIVSRNFAV